MQSKSLGEAVAVRLRSPSLSRALLCPARKVRALPARGPFCRGGRRKPVPRACALPGSRVRKSRGPTRHF